jgi:tetratricopeptide (TPR) repeat protein
LLDPESKKIAEDDDSGSGNNARLIVTLPTSGTYTIIANAHTGEAGNYTLSWREGTSDDLALAEAKKLNQQVLQLINQGQYAAAIPLAERALAIREKVLGQEHPLVATSLNNLANLYQDMGNYQKVEPLFQRSLAIREKVLGQEHPDVASSLNNLAVLYKEMGNYQKAEPLYQRSLAIREKVLGKEHPSVATGLNNLAVLYQAQGNYSQAEPLFQRSLAIYQKVLGAEHPNVANSLNNLAALYRAQGNYSQAEPLFQRSLAIWEKVLGAEHPNVATSLNNLADLYWVQGNYSQAEPLLQRSLAIREKVLGQEHPDVAISLNGLVNLYQVQGKYSQAEPLYQRSLAILEKALGKEHPNIATSLNGLAVLYQTQGKYSQAEPLYQRSLEILEKVLGKEHPNVANSLNNLAVLYQAQGDIARTLEFWNRSNNIEERNLALIFTTGSEAQKSAYIATLSGTTDATVSLHVQAAPNNPQATRLALATVLQRKGRVLDALTDSLQTLRQNLKPEDQTLLDKLATTRSQLSALIFKQVDNKQSDQYRQQVGTLKAQADELEATLSRRSAQFRKASQPVTLEAVQQLIPADAALVELVLYQPFNPKATKPDETWSTPRYVAYVLHSQGEAKWVDIGEAAPINQSVEDFRKALQSDASDVQPVARKLLGNTRNVLLSPDSQLNLIPFAALVDENNRYLLENYSINYLSSGRDLLRLQNHAQSRSAPVVMANPDYDKPGDPTSVQLVARGGSNQNANARTVPLSTKSAQTRNSNNRGLIDVLQQSFAPLPNTAQEADAIAQLLSGVTVLTGSQATENAIKQLHGSMILHIATHGFFHLGEDVQEVAPPDFSVTTFLQNTRSAKLTVRPSEALRQTQLEMLRSQNYQHPYYWAAFIPSGDWTAMGQ